MGFVSSVSSSIQIENPIPSTNPSVTPSNSDEIPDLWSKKEICTFTKGCLIGDSCYPNGYRIDNEYCGVYLVENAFERTKFISQSADESICEYDFECSSNLCENKRCVNVKQIEELKEKIIQLEAELDNLKNENIIIKTLDLPSKSLENEELKNNSKKEDFFSRLWNKIRFNK
jgi:hypothetical protein